MSGYTEARWPQPDPRVTRVFPNPARRQAPARLVALGLFDLEFVAAFGLFVAMLFINQLGSLSGLMIVGLTFAYVLLHVVKLYEILLPRAFILTIPFVIVMSTLWSETPSETLKYAIEFCITVVMALMLSASRRPAKGR